ncbi:MAG TPA: helix-turn-helix domain-containing protein [Actinomycetales bacterium]|nr:helix-turn-helix domain-containing protein [Actinomycetales bacterium]
MFEQLGLAADEGRVYLAVLKRGGAAAAELAQVLASPAPQDLQATLEGLRNRGLVERTATSPVRYLPVDPAVALASHVAAKERDLQQSRRLMDELADQYARGVEPVRLRSQDVVEVVVGASEVMDRLRGEHRLARRQVRSMERPPYVRVNTKPNPIELELLSQGVTHRVIYEQDAVDLPGRLDDIVAGIEAGEQARVVPRLPGKVLMVDDRVAMLPARTGALVTDALLVVHPGALLNLVGDVFESAWERAMPLRVSGGSVGGDNSDEQLMLNLLASGLTDDAIARHLDVSVRTVHRRVQELYARLGARTRFQAGLQASRRGLL